MLIHFLHRINSELRFLIKRVKIKLILWTYSTQYLAGKGKLIFAKNMTHFQVLQKVLCGRFEDLQLSPHANFPFFCDPRGKLLTISRLRSLKKPTQPRNNNDEDNNSFPHKTGIYKK